MRTITPIMRATPMIIAIETSVERNEKVVNYKIDRYEQKRKESLLPYGMPLKPFEAEASDFAHSPRSPDHIDWIHSIFHS